MDLHTWRSIVITGKLCCFVCLQTMFLAVSFLYTVVMSLFILLLLSMPFSPYDTNLSVLYEYENNFWISLYVPLLWRYRQWKSVKFILNHPVVKIFWSVQLLGLNAMLQMVIYEYVWVWVFNSYIIKVYNTYHTLSCITQYSGTVQLPDFVWKQGHKP